MAVKEVKGVGHPNFCAIRGLREADEMHDLNLQVYEV